ncbi:hypothetical protein ASD11_14590 [Aeromicrobium sp. Root495]|uniref:hypothetical protein n=1 Tax=Aeromicrobium sp. Root495 TaxID=1736550 RepID=UPI0006FB56B1|nr:hypothetical protein [Aeromicrobium sp. Root495]KQY55737.1 hypothetical protein ASD11_14590 [Aeromicrobium sp. Root495]
MNEVILTEAQCGVIAQIAPTVLIALMVERKLLGAPKGSRGLIVWLDSALLAILAGTTIGALMAMPNGTSNIWAGTGLILGLSPMFFLVGWIIAERD